MVQPARRPVFRVQPAETPAGTGFFRNVPRYRRACGGRRPPLRGARARPIPRPGLNGPGISECPYSAYDPAAEGSLPAAVGELAEPGQFPVAVLRVVREDPPRGVAGRSAWQVQDKVVVLGHCLLLCASGRAAQAIPDGCGSYE